jgi:predicted RNA-binding Zn-ribbon protein involved in translation (DUF1610 family)
VDSSFGASYSGLDPTVREVSMEERCPACGEGARTERQGSKDGARYECERCGTFFMSRTCATSLRRQLDTTPDRRPIVSHALRRMQLGRPEPPEVTWDVMKRVLETASLPSVSDQVVNFVLWLGDTLTEIGPGELVPISSGTHQAVVGATTPEGVALVVDYLYDQGLVRGPKSEALGGHYSAHVTLTVPGWARYDEWRRGALDSRTAFMASAFWRRYSGSRLSRLLQAGREANGVHPLDEAPRAGLIDDRLRVEIRTARFLIAELTGSNLGAYWEAGFAEGLGKPVIYTCEPGFFKEKGSHFDTNHHLTVIWDANDLADAATRLKATIRATLPADAKLTDG